VKAEIETTADLLSNRSEPEVQTDSRETEATWRDKKIPVETGEKLRFGSPDLRETVIHKQKLENSE
jgi:hypothetical protein